MTIEIKGITIEGDVINLTTEDISKISKKTYLSYRSILQLLIPYYYSNPYYWPRILTNCTGYFIDIKEEEEKKSI